MKYYCTNSHCYKEVYEIEPDNKYKKYGKIIRSQYCYDCDNRTTQKLNKTPTAITTNRISKWQANQTKSYSKSK